MGFDYLLLRFIVYAFLGWILESTYKTLGQRRGFINSGFLRGPLIPIYGFGAVMILVLHGALSLPLALEVPLFAILCTAFEYLVGLLYETVFKIKLWDYSSRRFNLHGRVCLKNGLLWALLVLAFLVFLRPAVERLLALLPGGPALRWAAYAIAALALADAARSTAELKSTAEILARVGERLGLAEPEALRAAMRSLNRRFLSQFPHLRELAAEAFHSVVGEALGGLGGEGLLAQAGRILKSGDEAGWEEGYREAVADLMADEAVGSMAGIAHHDGSILDHCLRVSRISYLAARRFGLDARAAARGGLLHDFFLYDWRREKGRRHATRHAAVALENARARFALTDVEADCILTHMWPLSRDFYRHRESIVVSAVDKLVSTWELGGVDWPELLRQLVEKRLGPRP